MKFQAKPFVVEVKRKGREPISQPAGPRWDAFDLAGIAAQMASDASDDHVQPEAVSPQNAPLLAPAARRILPVIEVSPPVEAELPVTHTPEPQKAAIVVRDLTKKLRASDRRSANPVISTEQLVLDSPKADETADSSAASRERAKRDAYPPGHRWKHRLPKVLRDVSRR